MHITQEFSFVVALSFVLIVCTQIARLFGCIQQRDEKRESLLLVFVLVVLPWFSTSVGHVVFLVRYVCHNF